MGINTLLERMAAMKASDLYLTTGVPPTAKVAGKFVPLNQTSFLSGEVKRLAYSIMDTTQQEQFRKDLEINFSYVLDRNDRFRVNAFIQQAEAGMVIRRINTTIPTVDGLQLPPILKELALEKRGLILFVGATGCGKSTSLAAVINHRNTMLSGHIITIEDPIEYIHHHKKSIITQREVGLDTLSYASALSNALRQSPDVILIGEIRAREPMQQVISFSETGHLCFSTLHTINANQTFERIINFFPKEYHEQLLFDLSLNVRAVISQRLVHTIDGKQTLAIEILINTPVISSFIRRGEFHNMKEIMEKSTELGMQSFDQSLEKLYCEGKITLEEALHNADSKNNLRLRIRLRNKLPPEEQSPPSKPDATPDSTA